jgi:hypothetical protein
MAGGRVSASKAFTHPQAYPRCRPLPARQAARGRKTLFVPAPNGYSRMSGLPVPAPAVCWFAAAVMEAWS